jgi:hypothetical protein
MPIEFIPESMQRLCAPAARARRCESRSSITRIVLESAVVGILATVCVAWWQVWTVDLSAPPGSQFGARAGWTVATRTDGSCVSILSNATGPQAQQAAAISLPSWSIANRAVDPADLGSFDPRLNDARRAARGLCSYCAYPRVQSSPCSECGATHEPLGTQTIPFTPPK